jgi:CheY-like chemotaxis protein
MMAKILLIEDCDDLRAITAKVLKLGGHEVKLAANGREGLASILAETPDVILTDITMPDLDGASLLEVVRSYLRISGPVVVLTALDDGPLVDRIRAQKVNAILVKGKASSDDILAAIKDAS